MNCGKELDFSVSTNSPLQFYFNDDKSTKSSDTSEDNELEDPSYCPIIKKKTTKKYSTHEKYKEMLSVLNKIYSLIKIIQDRIVIKPVVSNDMKLELFTNGILHSYQISGYKWILSLFENGLNGILADEMGLGKTIQIIAFFCHVVQNNVPGPFLVVVPLSILPNWMHELQRFAPKLPVLFHYGCNRMEHLSHFKLEKIEISDNLVVECYPIILTSFEIAKRDVGVFQAITFKAVIIDEGHRMKNYDSKLLNALKKYKSDLRLILTGTPLQNNLFELWCLLSYVMPDIFRSVEAFKDWLTPSASLELFQNEVIYEEEERALITTIHKLLSPFILRRLKSEVQLSVPSKKEIILSISLTEDQKA